MRPGLAPVGRTLRPPNDWTMRLGRCWRCLRCRLDRWRCAVDVRSGSTAEIVSLGESVSLAPESRPERQSNQSLWRASFGHGYQRPISRCPDKIATVPVLDALCIPRLRI